VPPPPIVIVGRKILGADEACPFPQERDGSQRGRPRRFGSSALPAHNLYCMQ
jgi:hypothetical protein